METYDWSDIPEWRDGSKHLEVAQRKAKEGGKWTIELKELAVFGAAMMTSAECGVTDNLQAFACHSDGGWKQYSDESWEEFIEKEFERIFNVEYKSLNK